MVVLLADGAVGLMRLTQGLGRIARYRTQCRKIVTQPAAVSLSAPTYEIFGHLQPVNCRPHHPH